MRPSRDAVFALLLLGFTTLGAILLKVNPVTGSEPSWYGAAVISFVGNLALGLIALRWLARYVEAPALALAAGSMAIACIGIAAAGLAHTEVIFTSSDRQEAAAEITRPLFEQHVPATHKPYIPSASAVKLDDVRFRICVEPPDKHAKPWCSVVDATDADNPKVESFGPGESNFDVARQIAKRNQLESEKR